MLSDSRGQTGPPCMSHCHSHGLTQIFSGKNIFQQNAASFVTLVRLCVCFSFLISGMGEIWAGLAELKPVPMWNNRLLPWQSFIMTLSTKNSLQKDLPLPLIINYDDAKNVDLSELPLYVNMCSNPSINCFW